MPFHPPKLAIFTIIAVCAIFFAAPCPANAATLEGASDYITSSTPEKPLVPHSVAFFIPTTSHTIIPTDYIRITFTGFSDVTAPTSGTGWTGTPTYGVIGSTAYITNVSVSPTNGIGISGITATNPTAGNPLTVTIEIANDINGTIVYDSITFEAEVLQGTSTTSVSITYYNSSVVLNGYTSPEAFVTIFINGSVAGTVTADSEGNFSKTFDSLLQFSTFTFSISARDTLNRITQSIEFSVYTLPFTQHIINHISLPTTISLLDDSIQQGDVIPVEGRGHPYSQIALFIEGTPFYEIIQADGTGRWSYQFSTALHSMSVGQYSLYAKEIIQGGYECIPTEHIPFEITQAPPTPPTNVAAPIITSDVGPSGEWINENTVTFMWDIPHTATGFSYILTQSDTEDPDRILEPFGVRKRFSDLTDGIYYFKIIATNGDTWSPTATYILNIDTTPPINLIVTTEPPFDTILDRAPILSFSATDALSGMDYYEISIDGGPYIRATSPYQFESITSGPHFIRIWAYDKAGNNTTKTIAFTVIELDPPVITNPHSGDEFPVGEIITVEGDTYPYATVRIYLDGVEVGTATADKDGHFIFKLEDDLKNGNHILTATVQNANNVISSPSLPVEISILTDKEEPIDSGLLAFIKRQNPWYALCCCPPPIFLILMLIFLKRRRRKKDKTRKDSIENSN